MDDRALEAGRDFEKPPKSGNPVTLGDDEFDRAWLLIELDDLETA